MSSPSGLQGKTILMIGSTGHGKSTLGNFLLNSDERYQTQRALQSFTTARANEPETMEVSVKCDNMANPTLHVIDTPGLNESAREDLTHMIDIVRNLRRLETVTACILCIRFEAKIDAQYKATLAYYRNLLPKLFEGNVLIVLTNYATDTRSSKVREMQGIDVDLVVKNTVREVRAGAVLSYDPQVFLIDCLPLDLDSDDHNRKDSEKNRLAILDYISKSMQPIKVKDLKVAKTNALRQRDVEEIKALDGEIHGYNVRLKQVNAKAEVALGKIEEMEKKKSKFDRQLLRFGEELLEKDSPDHVTAAEWSLSKRWKFLGWQQELIDCVSAWPVVSHNEWDNGHIEWDGYKVIGDRAFGTVKGEFCRGLYANVTLKTSKSTKYALEIRHLKASTEAAEKESHAVSASLGIYREEQRDYAQDIKLLQDYIKEKNKEKIKLSSEYMTLEEAERRISDLTSNY